MANEGQSRFADTMRELFSLEMYKRTQGRLLRSLTAAGMGLMLVWGLYSLAAQLKAANEPQSIAYGVPIGLATVFGWMIFRVYNWPRFADFLIATEAEMTKVSWSSKTELKRATAVVLITMFLIAGFLFSVDMVWSWFLEKIKVLKEPATTKKLEQAQTDGRTAPAYLDYTALRC
jgi:preprotein translocase subunit SecE